VYCMAATFENKAASGRAYKALRTIALAHERLDISIYRYLHIRLKKWCVTLIGNRPSERFQRQFEHILSTGTIVHLTDTEIGKLLERRFTNQVQGGGFAEYHYDPGEVI